MQFGIFFILLAVAVGALLAHSYRQMNREELELWRGITEKVYNHFQSQISDFLVSEDQRSFYQYRYYYVPAGQVGHQWTRNRSPISQMPRNDIRGLLGYFQIDPDNSFATPYLPRSRRDPQISNEEERRNLFVQLRNMTESLRGELREGARLPQMPRPEPVIPKASLSVHLFKSTAGRYDNIYPNPLEEQKMKLEKKRAPQTRKPVLKKSLPQVEAPSKEWPRRQVAASPGQLQAFEEQEAALDDLQGAGSLIGSAPLRKKTVHRKGHRTVTKPAKTSPSIYVDPFQARLVSNKHLIFYRKVWLSQKLYVQGFVVGLDRFFSWLMGRSFANSDLPRFAVSQLTLDDKALTEYGSLDSGDTPTTLLFARNLGYPLDRFAWQVYATFIPHLSTRLFLYVLTAILLFLMTAGLYLIYRSAAAQVHLSQKRQDFVSAVTHELKTPLTSIRMYSEMLEDGWAHNDEKKQEYYHHINKESSRLSRLVENVLQLARLEKGTYRINNVTASPETDFNEIGKELEGVAKRQGFTLSYKADEDLPPISYDAEAIKQVLLILFDNSIKFAANGSNKALEMTLQRSDDQVIWTWADRGPGIPEQELKKIFQNFYRVENEMTRTTKGTGIGLAMAQMIVETMGAKIAVMNREGGWIGSPINF